MFSTEKKCKCKNVDFLKRIVIVAEVINGRCHCGNITLCFNISSSFDELPIRACQCSFCRKHNVRATADPNGELEVYVKDKSKLSKYRFGLGLTDFLVCKECGIYVAAVMEDPENGKLLATCVVNALDVSDKNVKAPAAAHYEEETSTDRLQRRRKRWMRANLIG